MKNVKKYLFILILTIIVYFNYSIVTYANNFQNFKYTNELTQEDINNALSSTRFYYLLENFYNYPERLGLNKEQVQESHLGSPFNLIEINKNNNINLYKNIKTFPIYYNNTIIALLTLTKDNGEIYYSIGQSYAPEIQKKLNENLEDLVLFVDQNNDLYSIDKSNNKSLINPNISSNANNEYKIYFDNSELINYDKLKIYNNVITEDNQKNIKISDLISQIITPNIVASDGKDWYIYPFPEIKQPNDWSCWATVIAAMARYEMPDKYSNLTPQQVWQTVGIYSTATISECKTAMQYFFKSPYLPQITGNYLNQQEVQIVTANDDPAFMFLANYEANKAHATALVGYSFRNNLYNIWLMDPAIGRTTLADVNTNGLRYTNNVRSYVWDNTIRLYYKQN
jgi:hypothetical protein